MVERLKQAGWAALRHTETQWSILRGNSFTLMNLRRTAFRRELHPERQRFYRIPGEPDLDYSD
jgi:hypothetical protein